MIGRELFILLATSFVSLSWQASTPTTPYYTAGVVEFTPAASILTPSQRLDNNLAAYLEIIASEEANETDILVFPEATLNNALQLTYVPNPKENVDPCNRSEYAYFLQKLSCQAKSFQKYLVINLVEKENCTAESQATKKDPRPCAEYGLNTYNTNVVFDRSGVVVSRYRKYNLYYEPWNVTYTPEYGQFDTDFGVKFGHFICFDILFYTPATELVKSGITDFIFTTKWYSELPFLTAVQTQQSWAYSYDVNLLAAGANNPSAGNTGSGIYAGKEGALISVMKSAPERKLYVAKVQKKGFSNTYLPTMQWPTRIVRQKRAITSYLKDIFIKRDSRIDAFATIPFDPSEEYAHLCHRDLCCHFKYKAQNYLTPPADNMSYQYRLAAFDGSRLYPGIDPSGWSVCSIIACINNTLEGCALAFDEDKAVIPNIVFDILVIEANFTKTKNALLMPSTVDDDLMPLPVDTLEYNVTDLGDKINARFENLLSVDNLLQFGIYVNYFGERSLSSALVTSRLLVALSSLITFIIYWRK